MVKMKVIQKQLEFCVNELVTELGTPTIKEPEIELKDR
jgi:hypothetical protein